MSEPWRAAPPPQPAAAAAAPVLLPDLPDPMRQRGHVVLVALMFVMAAVGVVGAGFFAITSGDARGSGLSLLYALLPLPALLACFFWLDRYEPEPWHYKLAAVVWGGVGAVSIALAAQLTIDWLWSPSLPVMATVVAPLTEEPAKALFLVLTFVRMRRVIDGLVDGLVFAGLVGLGFAFVENVGYYAGSYVGIDETTIDGPFATTMTFVLRGIMSPFAHPMFTAAFGIAVGIAVTVRSKPLKVLLWVGGLVGSILLHGLWNAGASFDEGAWFLVVYVLVGGLLAGLIVLAVLARSRQGRFLARALTDLARRGWMVPDEIPFIAAPAYRRKAVTYARERGGDVASRATRRYQRDAVTTAFLHAGILEGRPKPQARVRVEQLLGVMRALRPYVVLPPPMRFSAQPVAPGYPPYAPPAPQAGALYPTAGAPGPYGAPPGAPPVPPAAWPPPTAPPPTPVPPQAEPPSRGGPW
ncbi:RsiW-degrading membrane proteinase PrsW (M82 family) [Mumia flava]|uniref:RsiW-degrading membrane proteinase PrsW (M82 family) n=1 Tax=Mumia flava TaxID=1348852 RepID=A0A2M9B8A8_9ACTN|nr:PrsW family intramembrane metalloprotease [Mumia flava]PJJ54193.1 RsiW-degrading membrane proteinase PrsW (M82 family) [Mumia flava]